MPTVGWIQERDDDRYLEECGGWDSTHRETHDCRTCDKTFKSAFDRDRHEIKHPVVSPTIFINGIELCGGDFEITSLIKEGSLRLSDLEFLKVNGRNLFSLKDDFLNIINSKAKNSATLDVIYGNSSIEKKVKIRVCIADEDELKMVDEVFLLCFQDGILDSGADHKFIEKIKNLNTVKKYSDGLVRYIQGLRQAEDKKNDVVFEKFNQASVSLKLYDTDLSHAVRDVINFNRNDFLAIARTSIPILEDAVSFFRGGDLAGEGFSNPLKLLPVDYATDYTLGTLLNAYKKCSLDEIKNQIAAISANLLSPQDRLKFEYICWRKSIQMEDFCSAKRYAKSLKYDDAFDVTMECG